MFMSLWNSFISGRVRYKFASFWNRNHTLKALQRAVNNYHAMLEVEKKVALRFLNKLRRWLDILLFQRVLPEMLTCFHLLAGFLSCRREQNLPYVLIVAL